MAVPGIRAVADARQRTMANAVAQAAWQALDCGFAAVADVFEDCHAAARRQLAPGELNEFLAAARVIGKLGRGPAPLLAFLECWPGVVAALDEPQSAILPALMTAIRRLQKSPDAPAVSGLLQTLGAVAVRLRTGEALGHYLALVVELAERTAGSIHGRQFTHPSPALPGLLAQAPRLLGLVSLAGLRRWLEHGLRLTAGQPDAQRAWFALDSADSRAVLQREREGTLFADIERRLDMTLTALWGEGSPLLPYSTALAEVRAAPWREPVGQGGGLRLPDALTGHAGLPPAARYRAMLAHLAAHARWSRPLIADNWSPLQRMAVETFEDARVDLLLLARLPGLQATLLALHPAPVETAGEERRENTLRHRLACLSRACLDPAHAYTDPLLLEYSAKLRELAASGASTTRAAADLALSWAARSRRASDQFANVRFVDTVVDYRDDNRHLWTFIEEGDEEESFDDKPRPTSDEAVAGLPPRHYPEWDDAAQAFRPDWASVYEALHPAGDAALIDRLLARNALLARRLKRLLDQLKPQDRIRLRHQENGSELDLDIAVRAWTDWRAGRPPEPRVQVSHRPHARDISVLVLVDLSQSLNATLPGGGQTLLDTAREAVALLGWAIGELGDACAIAGFHSNTRHEVRYHHIKGFSERWDDAVKARLAAVQAGGSTRMGAALRHAGELLAGRRSEKRILLVLTDGEPADVDVDDPDYLIADARKAVAGLSGGGIDTYCFSLDPDADRYVGRIFGKRWRVLDRVERLPEQLPMVYLNLTR